MFNILYTKKTKNKTVINDQGFALLGILITVFIIALIGYGVISYSGKKTNDNAGLENVDVTTTQGQLEALNGAKGDIEKINQMTANRLLNSTTTEELEK